MSLIVLDLDFFKQVNDRHGHLIGDLALRHVVDLIRAAKREPDILARFGGEEFVVLLPATRQADAETVAERIRAEVEASPLVADGSVVPLTVSLGVGSLAPGEPVPDIDFLIARADEALYRAKQSGRNQVAGHRSSHVPTPGADVRVSTQT